MSVCCKRNYSSPNCTLSFQRFRQPRKRLPAHVKHTLETNSFREIPGFNSQGTRIDSANRPNGCIESNINIKYVQTTAVEDADVNTDTIQPELNGLVAAGNSQ